MAHRLLPFRQYDENDVVNLFALETDVNLLTAKPEVDGNNADGVLVSVQNGNMTESDVVDASENNAFNNAYSSPVGRNPYPTNPLKIGAATSGDAVLGVTMMQTLAIDENNEQLLYNPVKKDELQAVLSGQTVPVLTKGLITVSSDAVDGTIDVGAKVSVGAPGKFGQYSTQDTESVDDIIGSVLASGFRGSNKTGPSYHGVRDDFASGAYYVIKLDC